MNEIDELISALKFSGVHSIAIVEPEPEIKKTKTKKPVTLKPYFLANEPRILRHI